ncbi:MAG TPA: hypothetical protein VK841_05785, partial [Polyangiaceae bacterium]|nr:hypothetical protein [Polyangiaceae bacterium]
MRKRSSTPSLVRVGLAGSTMAFVLAACSVSSNVSTTGGPGGDSSVPSLGFAPSNVAAALVGLDLSNLPDIDSTETIDQTGVDCNATPGCIATTVTQSDGSVVNLYVAHSWRIEANAVVTIADSKPLVIVALTTIDILGRLDASSQGDDPIAGGIKGVAGMTGGGAGGGLAGQTTDNTPGIGGGGGGFCGAGGAGGNATSTLGAGGASYGSATLIPLTPGSAGGGAELAGGGSGGAVQLVAGISVTIEAGGIVAAGGGGGAPGGPYSAGQAAAGGGSGGAVLIEAPSVSVLGTIEV